MARPLKRGMDYFPFDVGFFNDRKIKELRGKYGSDGITVYIYLLCLIYEENGYYIQLDDGFDYVTSADLNMDSEKIGQIINFLCKRSLFDDKLFTSDKVLTSHGIQTRFQEIVKARGAKKEIEVNEKFWVLKKDETQSYIKVIHFEGFSENNPCFSENNPCFSEEKPPKEKVKEKVKIKEKYTAIVQRVVDEWNTLGIYGIPKILKIDSKMKRYKSLTEIIQNYSVEDIFRAIDNIRYSDFLQGKTGERQWKIDFDFFVRPDKFVKILEGAYGGNTQSGKTDFNQRQYKEEDLEAAFSRKKG